MQSGTFLSLLPIPIGWRALSSPIFSLFLHSSHFSDSVRWLLRPPTRCRALPLACHHRLRLRPPSSPAPWFGCPGLHLSLLHGAPCAAASGSQSAQRGVDMRRRGGAGRGGGGPVRPDAVFLDVFNCSGDVKALGHIVRLVLGGIVRPIQALGQILSPAAASVTRRSAAPPSSPPPPTGDVSHHSSGAVKVIF